jgi:uncharacterized membrane protein
MLIGDGVVASMRRLMLMRRFASEFEIVFHRYNLEASSPLRMSATSSGDRSGYVSSAGRANNSGSLSATVKPIRGLGDSGMNVR